MKSIITGLTILFFILQYQLWFAQGSLISAHTMRQNIEKQKVINAAIKKRNDRLKADIKDLKYGKHALEERARNDLGMIKKDETLYQVVKDGRDQKDT